VSRRNEAKTLIVVPVIGVVPVPRRRPRVLWVVVPRATTNGCCPGRLIKHSIGMFDHFTIPAGIEIVKKRWARLRSAQVSIPRQALTRHRVRDQRNSDQSVRNINEEQTKRGENPDGRA